MLSATAIRIATTHTLPAKFRFNVLVREQIRDGYCAVGRTAPMVSAMPTLRFAVVLCPIRA